MDQNKKQHINYNLSDIEQYLQGKLSPAEMHALEKAALQDPFLADAIEGYRVTNLSVAKNDLADIVNDIQGSGGRVSNRPLARTTTRWWRIAATIVLMAGAASLGWYLLNTPKNSGPLAEQVPAESKNVAEQEKKAADPGAGMNDSSSRLSKNRADNLVYNKPPARQKQSVAVEGTLAGREGKATPARLNKAGTNQETLTQADQIALNKSVTAAATGGITSLGALANLSVSGTVEAGTISETFMAANQPAMAPPRTMQKMRANENNERSSIQLQSSPADLAGNQTADSSTVINRRSKPRMRFLQTVAGRIVGDSISPQGGWEKFNRSLGEKIADAGTGVVHGIIEMQVELSPEGKITSAIITKTFLPSLNNTLIQAVKDGPAWSAVARKVSAAQKLVLIL